MNIKEIISKIAVMIKRISLFFVIHIILGNILVNEANVAPMPILTRVTGRAQHKRVLNDPKSEKKAIIFCIYFF